MRLRLLYIGINRSYVNPTTNNLLIALSYNFDIYRYGPGFSDEYELKMGIDLWIEKFGDFEIIMTDSMILECSTLLSKPFLFENESIYFPKRLFKEYAIGLKNYFINSKKKKIFIANWDYYAVKTELVEILIRDQNLYVISNVDLNTSLSVEEVNARGNLMIENIFREYPMRSNIWHDFITKYSHKILSMPNTVNENNFIYTKLNDRSYRYCVPGFPYRERRTARTLFNTKEWVSHYRVELIFFIEKISRKLLIPRPHNWSRIQTDRLFYRVSNSKMAFTSGAVTRTPIAKYFEIPASGTVMICQECAGFVHLGFVDNVNCFVAEDLQTLKSVLLNFEINKYQKIADSGRELIYNKHTVSARSYQLKECIERICQNSFNGSHWENGNFVIN